MDSVQTLMVISKTKAKLAIYFLLWTGLYSVANSPLLRNIEKLQRIQIYNIYYYREIFTNKFIFHTKNTK